MHSYRGGVKILGLHSRHALGGIMMQGSCCSCWAARGQAVQCTGTLRENSVGIGEQKWETHW